MPRPRRRILITTTDDASASQLPAEAFYGRDSERARLLAWAARLGHSGRFGFPSSRQRASDAVHAAADLAAEALVTGQPHRGQRLGAPAAHIEDWIPVARRNDEAAVRAQVVEAPWVAHAKSAERGDVPRGSGEPGDGEFVMAVAAMLTFCLVSGGALLLLIL